MRFLIAGRGAEDGRSPLWGHAVRSLGSLGHKVFEIDPAQAAVCDPEGDPTVQHQWALRETRPDRVIVAPITDDDVAFGAFAEEQGFDTLYVNIEELCPAGSRGVPVRAAVWTDVVPEHFAPRYDVIVCGDASPLRATLVDALLQARLDVRVYGRGWQQFEQVKRIWNGPLPYPVAARHLRKARVVAALPFEIEARGSAGPITAALEAAAVGRPCVAPHEAVERLGGHAVAFTDANDIVSSVRNVLDAGDEAETRANLAAEHVRFNHSWHARWTELVGADETTVKVGGPRVTVLTAAYNVEEFLGGAVESVLSQTFDDFELLICQDSSQDGTLRVAERYVSDPRVRIVDQSNIGRTGRFDFIWRRLLQDARGELVAWLGSDDVAHEERLLAQVDRFDNQPDLDVLHSAGTAIDAGGRVLGNVFGLHESYDVNTMTRSLMRANMVALSTVMIRRDAFDRLGPMEEGFASDTYFWLKSAGRLTFGYLPRRLIAYRIDEKVASANSTGGVDRAYAEGMRARRLERSQRSIVDLYPALDGVDDPRAIAAAHLDLGNRLILSLPDTELAIEEYDEATSILGREDAVVGCNKAQAMAIAGEYDDALALLDRHAVGVVDLVKLRESIRRHAPREELMDAGTLFDSAVLSKKPFEAAAATAWDGLPATTSRMLVIPDWEHPETLAPVLEQYLQLFSAADDVDLMIGQFGISSASALDQVSAHLPNRRDLQSRGGISLEEVDELSLLPGDRYKVLLNMSMTGPDDIRSAMVQFRKAL